MTNRLANPPEADHSFILTDGILKRLLSGEDVTVETTTASGNDRMQVRIEAGVTDPDLTDPEDEEDDSEWAAGWERAQYQDAVVALWRSGDAGRYRVADRYAEAYGIRPATQAEVYQCTNDDADNGPGRVSFPDLLPDAL